MLIFLRYLIPPYDARQQPTTPCIEWAILGTVWRNWQPPRRVVAHKQCHANHTHVTNTWTISFGYLSWPDTTRSQLLIHVYANVVKHRVSSQSTHYKYTQSTYQCFSIVILQFLRYTEMPPLSSFCDMIFIQTNIIWILTFRICCVRAGCCGNSRKFSAITLQRFGQNVKTHSLVLYWSFKHCSLKHWRSRNDDTVCDCTACVWTRLDVTPSLVTD